jgi:isorenieratene synthase
MKSEYLLFDLLVLAAPFVLGFMGPTFFRGRSARAWLAVALAAIPFLIWDAMVAGRHWNFSEAHTLGPELFGLPVEEWLFFAVVPYALIFSWEMICSGSKSRPNPSRAWIRMVCLAAIVPGLVMLVLGFEYTGLTLIALSASAAVDRATGSRVLERPAFGRLLLVVGLSTLVFDGYLTSRPVVTYDDSFNLGLRVASIPIEDFVYGLSSGLLAISLYTWFGSENFVDDAIRRRFGGYRHEVVVPEPSLPYSLPQGHEASAAVIGSGIAGIRAASELARRGFRVVLVEKEDYIGGKIGAWHEVLDGKSMPVEHGFHAFFHHYYNLNDFLDELGVRESFEEIEDYAILTSDGRRFGFDGVRKTPLLNLFSLLSTGLFKLGDVVFNPRTHKMQAFVEYEQKETFERFDDMSYAEFAEEARLPDSLRLIFNSFSRAFFAPAEKMSMAEMIKSFHYYFLGHDRGLGYDFPTEHYEDCLLGPIRRHLEGLGVEIRTGSPVRSLNITDSEVRVDDEPFDYLVLATDVVGTRRILEASPELLLASPRLRGQVKELDPSNPYAVLRVWADRDEGADLPAFVITDKPVLLDSISFYHRIEGHAREWADAHHGGVYELHCYAIPEDFGMREADIEAQLLEDLFAFLPELRGMKVVHKTLQVRQNFTALHVSKQASRPETATEHPRVVLAGDWVKLPVPAMLMEGACTSALYAANTILAQEGLRSCGISSIPTRGLLRQES